MTPDETPECRVTYSTLAAARYAADAARVLDDDVLVAAVIDGWAAA